MLKGRGSSSSSAKTQVSPHDTSPSRLRSVEHDAGGAVAQAVSQVCCRLREVDVIFFTRATLSKKTRARAHVTQWGTVMLLIAQLAMLRENVASDRWNEKQRQENRTTRRIRKVIQTGEGQVRKAGETASQSLSFGTTSRKS